MNDLVPAQCLFCDSFSWKKSEYPDTFFNGKIFRYITCKNCRLVYLNPLPNADDYIAMYPPSYQAGVSVDVREDISQKMPGLRFSYATQLNLIEKYCGKGCTVLDYGCGNGDFIANASARGFVCAGAEFSEDYVQTLADNLPQASFYTIDKILELQTDERFDVIRLSNVLEHLTNPKDVSQKLLKALKHGGILLVEGPVEHNKSLSFFIKNIYFSLTKQLRFHKSNSYPPYHIFLSDKNNQRSFFRKLGLTELMFTVEENAWPLPADFRSARGVKKKVMALLAMTSIYTSRISRSGLGNTFLYVGKSNELQQK